MDDRVGRREGDSVDDREGGMRDTVWMIGWEGGRETMWMIGREGGRQCG